MNSLRFALRQLLKDLTTRIAACVLMAAAGLLAIWWPARRAARRDPIAVLKEG